MIKIQGTQLTISANKAPVLIRIVMTLFLTILILIPLAATFYSFTYNDGFHFGILLTFILFWGVGFYLLRVILWNSVGQEILTFNQDNISYIADYKLFKDGRQEITTADMATEIIYEDEHKKSFGRLKLRNESTSIETVFNTTITELEEIRNEIKTRYNTR